MTKTNIIFKILIFCQAIFILFGTTSGVLAQSTTTSTPSSSTSAQAKPLDVCKTFGSGSCLSGTDTYSSGESKDIITSLTTNIINLLTFIAGGIAVLFIVFGGYKYITANGEESKAKEARGMVINACIGLIIILASYTIVTAVASFIGTLNIGGNSGTSTQ